MGRCRAGPPGRAEHCVGCHGDPAGAGQAAPDLRGDQPDQPLELRRKKRAKTHGFDAAYLALHPFVRRPGPESDYHLPKPYEFHASRSSCCGRDITACSSTRRRGTA